MHDRETALEHLYRRRYAGFRSAVATITGDYESARDVVQEGFARALAHLERFRGDGTLDAWVWQIVYRTALTSMGKSTGKGIDELDIGLVEPDRDPTVAAAIKTLPPRRRLVIFLRYFADLSYAEIAAAVGISEGAVAATIAQAHEQLQKRLEQEVEGEREVVRSS